MNQNDNHPGRIGFDPQSAPERAAHRLYAHVVWSTRGRDRLSSPTQRGAVESHLISLCRRLDVEPLAVVSLTDRVHLLLRFKPTQSLGSIVGRLKEGLRGLDEAGSAVHWARGYAAVTIGSRDVRRIMRFLARLGDACDAASRGLVSAQGNRRRNRRRPLTRPAGGG